MLSSLRFHFVSFEGAREDPKTRDVVLLSVRADGASDPCDDVLARPVRFLADSADDCDESILEAASFLVGDEMDEGGWPSAFRFGDGAEIESRRPVGTALRGRSSSSLDVSGEEAFLLGRPAFLAAVGLGETGGTSGSERLVLALAVVDLGAGMMLTSRASPSSSDVPRDAVDDGGGDSGGRLMARVEEVCFAFVGELVAGLLSSGRVSSSSDGLPPPRRAFALASAVFLCFFADPLYDSLPFLTTFCGELTVSGRKDVRDGDRWLRAGGGDEEGGELTSDPSASSFACRASADAPAAAVDRRGRDEDAVGSTITAEQEPGEGG